MTIFIGVIGQKGGIGKSTVSRLVAREYINSGWSVKIADLDITQGTNYNWQARRLSHGLTPDIPVERFRIVDQVLKVADPYDLVIFDSPPHSTRGTLAIAEASNLLVLPTGLALDDLEPSVLLAHELIGKGILNGKIVFALCRVGSSESEIDEARDYITKAGYTTLEGALPEKLAYRRASDTGRTATETRFPTLNQKADQLAQSIIDTLTKLYNMQA